MLQLLAGAALAGLAAAVSVEQLELLEVVISELVTQQRRALASAVPKVLANLVQSVECSADGPCRR